MLRIKGTFIEHYEHKVDPRRSVSAPPELCRYSHEDDTCKANRALSDRMKSAKVLHTVSPQNGKDERCIPLTHTSEIEEEDNPGGNEVDAAASIEGKATVPKSLTTMILFNIPCKTTIRILVEAVDILGFANTFNYVNLPTRAGRREVKNSSYAFINFKNPELAAAFARAFDGFSFPHSGSGRWCYAEPACEGCHNIPDGVL